jgi:Bacterial membrane protein YfhO
VATGFADPPPGDVPGAFDVVRGAGLLVWIGVAGAAVALVAFAGRGRAAVVAGLAVALVAVDLARAGVGQNPAVDRAVAEQPLTPGLELLQRAAPARFVSTGDIPQNAIPMNFALFEARGYDLPVERRFDRLWRTQLSPEFPSQVGEFLVNIPLSLPALTPDRLPALRLMGVTHVLQPPTDPPLDVPGLELVHPGPDVRVYALAGAHPRAMVVGAQTVAGSEDEAFAAVTAPGFDPQRAAVTEEPVPGLPRGGAEPAGSARIVRTEPDRLVVDAAVERPGLLVVTDAWYPGWTATVDGRQADVERVDYVFRGVRVEPGEHRVELEFRPLSWRLGWIVSLLALIALVAAVALPRRRRAAARRARARAA